VLLIAGGLLIGESDYYTYTYSFEPTYELAKGTVRTCTSYEHIDSLSCGDLDTGEEFLSYYIQAKGDQALKSGKATVSDFFQGLREKGLSDADIVRSLLKDRDFSYKAEQHWNLSKLLKNISIAIGISILWYLSTFVIYKVILFIAHGHTRVRKA
jgi:hypothetical protein